jgi:hypothetical protein
MTGRRQPLELLAGEIVLGRAQRRAQVEQLVDQLRPLAGERVQRPGAGRRLAQLLDLDRQSGVPGRLGRGDRRLA